jgi:hypothetical protein
MTKQLLDNTDIALIAVKSFSVSLTELLSAAMSLSL